MSALEKIPPRLIALARPLDELGLSEVAWSGSLIKQVLKSLEGSGVAILGGDVYREDSDGIKATYDNWHSERRLSEPMAKYAERTWRVAWDYVHRYPYAEDPKLLYVLVMSDEPTAGL